MNSPLQVPLYVAVLLIVSLVVSADSSDSYILSKQSSPGEIYAACNVVNYRNGSEFANNINLLFKNVTEQASEGFSTAIYGQNSPNKLYGRLQCRGELAGYDCHACSVQAVESVRRQCPNAIGARVQFEYCFLRYENYSFLSKLDTNLWYTLVNVTSNADEDFNKGVNSLLTYLSSKAAASPRRSDSWSRDVSSNLTIWGMEMCWRDVSSKDCSTCLAKGIEQMFSCYKKRVGVQLFMGSCTLRYEIYPFLKRYG